MRTATIKLGVLQRDVRVSGTIAWDLREARTVSARTDGLIDRLYVRAPLDPVQAGQPLATMIAPQWDAAAEEYLALRAAKSADARALLAAARVRLEALGIDAQQVRELRPGATRIVLRAPLTGVVSALAVREGDQVRTGMPLMTVNGLDTVWLDAAIPQAESAGIAAGSPVLAHVSAVPDVSLGGHVEALLPDVDAATRTQRARIVLENQGHRLAPGMFADLTIRGAAGTERTARAGRSVDQHRHRDSRDPGRGGRTIQARRGAHRSLLLRRHDRDPGGLAGRRARRRFGPVPDRFGGEHFSGALERLGAADVKP